MNTQKITIDTSLVCNLVASQFPQWKDLPIKPILPGGWDNRCYQLGDEMIVRLPSAERYADKVAKEQKWLPKLAANLSLKIPSPLAMGNPSDQYPWHWSIYRWIPGQTVFDTKTVDKNSLAKALAQFLLELQAIDTVGAPPSGQHNFYRGGDLSVYDSETQNAIEILKEKIDVEKANHIWKKALTSRWQHAPAWVHGDISIGNLLMENGGLTAVIDFGGICVGDPACDLVMAWTFFDKTSRQLFQENMRLDSDTWDRARGWALWKALIVAADPSSSNEVEKNQAWHTLAVLFSE